jgi:hypothetical protein
MLGLLVELANGGIEWRLARVDAALRHLPGMLLVAGLGPTLRARRRRGPRVEDGEADAEADTTGRIAATSRRPQCRR